MFRSFIFAGFEGTTGSNLLHQWIDQVEATQHDIEVDGDYRRLREVGLRAARESIRPSLHSPAVGVSTGKRRFVAARLGSGHGLPFEAQQLFQVLVQREVGSQGHQLRGTRDSSRRTSRSVPEL